MPTPSLFLPRSYVQNIRSIPLSGTVQASQPVAPVDTDGFEVDQAVQLLLRGAQYLPGARAYQVVGHSMSGLIEHGEIVLVNPHDAFNTHRPCVFQTPNGYIVKTRGVVRGRPALLSRNPNVPPIFELAEFAAVGCCYGVYVGAYRVRFL